MYVRRKIAVVIFSSPIWHEDTEKFPCENENIFIFEENIKGRESSSILKCTHKLYTHLFFAYGHEIAHFVG